MSRRGRAYGSGLRILLVNDQYEAVSFLFEYSINDASFRFAKTVPDAMKLLRTAKEPFHVVFIDKNLGRSGTGSAQDVINAVERLSPNSHICIHSAETGPGELGRFPFIPLTGQGKTIQGKIRRFIRGVENQPFRTTPSKIDLSVLKRPVPILTVTGRVKVFRLVEGTSMPAEMERMIQEGGRALSIEEAIHGERVSAIDRAALIAERDRVLKFQHAAAVARKKNAACKPKTPRRRRGPK